MFKTTPIIVMAALCLNFSIKAQENKPLDVTKKGIQIGQKVPDITITNLHNYRDKGGKLSTIAKLSDFKGKLLILDFWATWCSPCVAMIPKMDSLQKQFGDKIQFLPVTREPESKVKELIKKTGWNPMQQLSYVIADTALNQLFPHTYIPHYVWINTNGIVQAITADTVINANAIRLLLNSTTHQLTTKADDVVTPFNITKELLKQQAAIDTNMMYTASLSSYRKGWPALMDFGSGILKNRKLSIINNPMVNLFRTAYAGKAYSYIPGALHAGYPYNRTITELKAPEYWLKSDQLYCYEQLVPDSSIEHSNQFMQQQLELMFPLRARLERRAMACYILIQTGKALSHISVADTTLQHSPLHLVMHKQSPGKLAEVLNHYLGSKRNIIIDESGVKQLISLELKNQLTDLETVRTALLPWGFTLKPAIRNIEVLVITDKNLN